MKNNSNNSDISKISDIIYKLYQLYHLLYYYFNPGVGHHAPLPFTHIISQLYHYYVRFFFHYSLKKCTTLKNSLYHAGIA